MGRSRFAILGAGLTVPSVQPPVPKNVVELLTRRFGDLTEIGVGAWSTAYRFRSNDEDLVVRVGKHVADFRIDEEIAAHVSPSLPIPKVLEVAQLDAPHEDLFICVSTYAPGQPLETVSSHEWSTLVPVLVDMFVAMRSIRPVPGHSTRTWATTLLDRDDGDGRLGSWRRKLESQAAHCRAFDQSIDRLQELCALPSVASAPLTLLHCDLINRNVHVAGGAITGVFDWGCRRWGDYLYELAWFEFWAPWFPNLDIGLLSSELSRRNGEVPDPSRFAACMLHIGADHLVYSAATDNASGGSEVLARMEDLKLI